MSTASVDVFSLALALPESQRLALATELLHSVKPPGVLSIDDPGFKEEIQRRRAEIDSGTATMIDGDTAMAQIRETLRQRRAGRQ